MSRTLLALRGGRFVLNGASRGSESLRVDLTLSEHAVGEGPLEPPCPPRRSFFAGDGIGSPYLNPSSTLHFPACSSLRYLYLASRQASMCEEYRERLVNAYDNTLRYMDHVLSGLIQLLQKRGGMSAPR